MSLASALGNRLFRWRSDGVSPIILTQRRIFIVPTRAGLLFALVLLVMLLGAINYSLSLGHALVFLLAGLGMTGMVHTFRNLAGLCLASGRPEPVFAGETAHFPVHLSSDRNVPRRSLEFRAGDAIPVLCDLDADGTLRIELPLPAIRRGWLVLPRTRLSTRYPLGLFVAWSYPHPEMRCLVYPRPLARPLPPAQAAVASGDHRGAGGHDDFAGLRQHQPADPPRHVAWKAVARDAENRPLLVKQFAGGAREELWLDWQALAAESDPETRLSILAGWILAAEAASLAYGLRLPGAEVTPGCGTAHQQQCLEILALFPDAKA